MLQPLLRLKVAFEPVAEYFAELLRPNEVTKDNKTSLREQLQVNKYLEIKFVPCYHIIEPDFFADFL